MLKIAKRVPSPRRGIKSKDARDGLRKRGSSTPKPRRSNLVYGQKVNPAFHVLHFHLSIFPTNHHVIFYVSWVNNEVSYASLLLYLVIVFVEELLKLVLSIYCWIKVCLHACSMQSTWQILKWYSMNLRNGTNVLWIYGEKCRK